MARPPGARLRPRGRRRGPGIPPGWRWSSPRSPAADSPYLTLNLNRHRMVVKLLLRRKEVGMFQSQRDVRPKRIGEFERRSILVTPAGAQGAAVEVIAIPPHVD